MSREIEHKYLVRVDLWKPTEDGVLYRQGYLCNVEERSVRVRIAGQQAFLTIKGPTYGITRLEFEYAIPVGDAEIMLNLVCQHPLIEKTRYPIVCRENVGNRCLSRRQYRACRCGDRSRERIRTVRAATLARSRSFHRPALFKFQPRQQPIQ